jgi:hypothetical protein
MSLPALRNLDMTPVNREGKTLFCLYDPEGLVEEQILLTPAAVFVASSLDGQNDVRDIQVAFARQFRGAIIQSEHIEQLVRQLDELGFLATDRFRTIEAQVRDAFAQSPTRKAYAAGKSYPADPGELRAFLASLFLREGGPGEGPVEPGSGPPAKAVIVPHIDFARGGHAYAHGYLGLYKGGKPRTAIVFGVAHHGPSLPFILTRKHFETPLGTVESDQDAVGRLAAACAWDPFEHEIVHRTEHSIEFQAVMLAYLYGADVRIVPILCGPLSEDPFLTGPESLEGVARFLATCRDMAAAPDNRVTVIAGADLAHVGKHFGDPFNVTQGVIRQVRARDEEDLSHVTHMEPNHFYRSVMKDHNQRKVCGLSSIYATLKTVDGAAHGGQMLCYDYAPDPAGGMVSFASVLFP